MKRKSDTEALLHRPAGPYAEREVRVDFVRTGLELRQIAAVNENGNDILADLIDTQCEDLHLELDQANIAFLDHRRPDRDRVAGRQLVSR